MILRILKFFFLIAATFSLGAFAFLQGFKAWRAGQVVVPRAHSDTDISWPTGLAIIGAAIAFFLYLGFRAHTQ
jgi:amino acid transporter